jgi:hypothetical protein
MIKNNLVYGFNENGVIGYTKNAIGDMSVLVHEYAHTYFTRNHDNINMVAVEELLTPSEKSEEFVSNARFQPIFTGLLAVAEQNTMEYDELKLKHDTELFSTAMGVTFKKFQDKLPTYESTEQMRKNLAEDVEKILGGGLYGYEILIDVLKSMCGKQQVKSVKSAKTISMKDILEKAKSFSELPAEQDAFAQGAKWALEQSGIKVAETETKVEEKVETPKEEKPKKPTAKKSTGKPKKATKKAKVEDKPTFDVGDEFDNGWLIVEYLGKGKYKIIDNEGNELVKTEKEIDEA